MLFDLLRLIRVSVNGEEPYLGVGKDVFLWVKKSPRERPWGSGPIRQQYNAVVGQKKGSELQRQLLVVWPTATISGQSGRCVGALLHSP